MLKARTNHASAALNGEIYAIGGKASPSLCPKRPPTHGSPSSPLGSLGASQSHNSVSPTPMSSPGTREPPGLRDRRDMLPRSCPQELAIWSKPAPHQGAWMSRGEAQA